MECQITTKNLKINKNKFIGKVIIVVEGESEEFKIMKHIFTKILNYNYLSIKRNKVMQNEFRSKVNPNSTVIVANTNSSNIKSIIEDKNYKDKLYDLLKIDYKDSLKNVPIYIIWDRDYESNEEKNVKQALCTFKSSLDNDFDMNGILLLNYPCIESYKISNFDKQLYKKSFKCSQDAKELCKKEKYYINNISENSIINAVGNMHRRFKNMGILKYDPSNFFETNNIIFKYQTDKYQENMIPALSLLSVMLVDLGIIYEE